ncbi:hypothetical protein LH464_04270 [Neorhizobium sp. T786]|uniref:hypothetical protein n=1 Tax=Pseudorhizobium xiangyangii TaxID=2883104 RepID=UPI001CFF84F7|nr:hypothetical protein [Neorhizobium xiangyangii]MCB5201693.1 hypothetical protein [Neorhizobium xiangyangii]
MEMRTNNTRATEIAEAEAALARLTNAQYAATMSNGRYYTDGSKTRDDHEIAEARRILDELKKDQA